MTDTASARLVCEKCDRDCSDNPFLIVHNDGRVDGPVCQTCATYLNGANR